MPARIHSAPVPDPFQPTQFGNYVLVAQLGRGGMAEVYKARSGGVQGFQKTLCIKRILRQHTDDKSFLEMFVNEAKISARLSHPNIVQVYELGEVDGEFFMAMEFVHGRDLLAVMRTVAAAGPPPVAVGAYIAREMCRALAHAHDQRDDRGQPSPIIHRDVSPQNVMISYEGIVKLVDFGIAKAAQQAGAEETRTGALKGKFAYMAPEQLDGEKASPQSDVFAVGVTLFEMLTAKRLFKGNTDYDTLVRVKTQPILPPSESNSAVSPELDRIVAKALARDATQRYQRAAEMARELDLLCAQEGFTAEDMKEFMHRIFPKREEIPDGAIALPAPTSMSGMAGSSGTSGGQRKLEPSVRPTSITPSRVAAVSPEKSRIGWFVGIAGLAAMVLAGGGFAAFHFGGRSPETAAPSTPPNEVATPAATEPRVRTGEAVELQSNPSGAEVLDGPRLLGTTPMTVKLTADRQTVTVHLDKPGYDELVYTLSSSDAPRLTLKLAPKRHHAGEKRPAVAPPPGTKTDAPKTPNVKSFDDVDTTGPHVKTIDE